MVTIRREYRKLASYIDHTLLAPDATTKDIRRLCREALRYGFASVCVNPMHVSLCARLVRGSGVKVCTVVGFPLGATSTEAKACEARQAVRQGADELDMVMPIGALKERNDAYVLSDIRAVRSAARKKVLKVIIETGYLTKQELRRACKLTEKAGADFVKTSTGFGPGGATVNDVLLMRSTVSPRVNIKAAGGIRTRGKAERLIRAGATRLGSSSSVSLVSTTDRRQAR